MEKKFIYSGRVIFEVGFTGQNRMNRFSDDRLAVSPYFSLDFKLVSVQSRRKREIGSTFILRQLQRKTH